MPGMSIKKIIVSTRSMSESKTLTITSRDLYAVPFRIETNKTESGRRLTILSTDDSMNVSGVLTLEYLLLLFDIECNDCLPEISFSGNGLHFDFIKPTKFDMVTNTMNGYLYQVKVSY